MTTTVSDAERDELLTLYEVSGPEMPMGARILMVVLALVITIAQIHTLQKLEDSIKRRRRRLNCIREHFTPIFRTAWEAGGEKPEYIKSIWFLRLAVVAGWVIVSWLLLNV